MTQPKTKRCSWCNKRKDISIIYFLEKRGREHISICSDCNIEENIV